MARDHRGFDQRGFVGHRHLAGDRFFQPQQYRVVFLLEPCDFGVGVSLCVAVDMGVQWNRGRRQSAVVAHPLCVGRASADAFGNGGPGLWFCHLSGRQLGRDVGLETGFSSWSLYFHAIPQNTFGHFRCFLSRMAGGRDAVHHRLLSTLEGPGRVVHGRGGDHLLAPVSPFSDCGHLRQPHAGAASEGPKRPGFQDPA